MKRSTSLKDIAQRANVSTAAVSYVLNNQEHRVSPDMAKRIKDIALSLNYRPNQIAKSLKTRKTHTIGLVVANISYKFTTGITSAIEAEAKKHNYTVLIGSSDEDLSRFTELVNVLVDRQVDGLILVPVENSEEEIKFLRKSGVPFVLIDRYFPGLNTNFIALDNYSATFDAVDYLARQGHSHIAFINYRTPLYHLQERSRGFVEAMKARRLPAGAKWHKKIRRERFQEDLSKSIDQILTEPHKKLALVFASDTLAIKGLKYLSSLGKKIPGDVSVLSFDESEAFELYACKITHGRQPLDEMGRLSVQTLLDVMENGKISKQLLLKSDFVPGESCGEER